MILESVLEPADNFFNYRLLEPVQVTMSGTFHNYIRCIIPLFSQCLEQLFTLYRRYKFIVITVHDQKRRHMFLHMTKRTGRQSLFRIRQDASTRKIGESRTVYQQRFRNGRRSMYLLYTFGIPFAYIQQVTDTVYRNGSLHVRRLVQVVSLVKFFFTIGRSYHL